MADDLLAALRQEMETLQAKDRDLKQERNRLEAAIKENRAKLHAVVEMVKDKAAA